MPDRLARRHRLEVWLDGAHAPLTASITSYDEHHHQVHVSVLGAGPFDTIGDLTALLLHDLDRQGTLWQDGPQVTDTC